MYRANEEQLRKAQEALDAMRSENAGLLQEKNELMGQKVAKKQFINKIKKIKKMKCKTNICFAG